VISLHNSLFKNSTFILDEYGSTLGNKAGALHLAL